jgi:DNA repair exonuclease SbcCD ATPase subunit
MKEAIVELKKQLSELRDMIKKLDMAIEAMENVEDFEGRLMSILQLKGKMGKIIEKKLTVENAIEALQDVCDHPEFIYSGHDSHGSFEKCVICGFERSLC